jgi:hypothetical protein
MYEDLIRKAENSRDIIAPNRTRYEFIIVLTQSSVLCTRYEFE